MISYPGYEQLIQRVYDEGQGHLFLYWEDLSDVQRRTLLEVLLAVDFELIKSLYQQSLSEGHHDTDFEPAPYRALPESDADLREYAKARSAGEEHLRQGKVAAFLVAGGQGTRLGYDGPKGMYPVAPVSGKTLFQIHAEKICKYSQKYKTSLPWMIMTSRDNHDETMTYFRNRGFFGLPEGDVFIFPQNMIPSLDESGKLILESPCTLFKNPDGHGGSLSALADSGILEILKKRGIQTISYFQVDNPLVRIIDPAFIGFHILGDIDVSSKALKKTSPDEKVGVFVHFRKGGIGIAEYSDLSREKQQERDAEGNLRYNMGNPAIHLFKLEFIERITGGVLSLPYHIARKMIRRYSPQGGENTPGMKFEKFVFDALLMTDRDLVFETERESEFGPVKNSAGEDSVETSCKLMDRMFRRWLAERCIKITDSVRVVEISPLLAVEAEDIPAGLEVPEQEALYLE